MEASPQACSDIVRAFDEQGWHRTATEVDDASGEWLVETLSALGVEARALRFPFSRVDVSECRVSVGQREIDGVHLPDSALPPPSSILRGLFRPGSFGLFKTGTHGVAGEIDALRQGSLRAVVVAVDGYPGAATLINAWDYDSPGSIPIIQVPASAWEDLCAARDAGDEVEIRCGGTRTPTTAFNVLARVSGRAPGKAPIVILTPRSGWWQCAGERGGGLAIWLEAARLADSLSLDRDVIFLATTGHELGFLGVKRYFDEDPGLARRAVAWIHLGANVGASEARLVVRASDPGMLTLAQHTSGFAKLPRGVRFELADRPIGEAGEVSIRGGRFVSLVGADFPRFHSTADRWPYAIDAVAIAAAGQSVLQLLRAIDGVAEAGAGRAWSDDRMRE